MFKYTRSGGCQRAPSTSMPPAGRLSDGIGIEIGCVQRRAAPASPTRPSGSAEQLSTHRRILALSTVLSTTFFLAMGPVTIFSRGSDFRDSSGRWTGWDVDGGAGWAWFDWFAARSFLGHAGTACGEVSAPRGRVESGTAAGGVDPREQMRRGRGLPRAGANMGCRLPGWHAGLRGWWATSGCRRRQPGRHAHYDRLTAGSC